MKFEVSKSIIDFRGKRTQCWYLSNEHGLPLYHTVNIHPDKFISIMISNFKAIDWHPARYLFWNEPDAQKALEWIEARRLVVELTGELDDDYDLIDERECWIP